MVISGSANYSLNCTISLIAFNCLRFPNCFHCALVRLLFLFSCYWFACRFYFAALIAFCVTISFCKPCHNSGCPRLLALLLFLIVFYFLSPPGRDLCQHRRLFINKLLRIDWQHARKRGDSRVCRWFEKPQKQSNHVHAPFSFRPPWHLSYFRVRSCVIGFCDKSGDWVFYSKTHWPGLIWFGTTSLADWIEFVKLKYKRIWSLLFLKCIYNMFKAGT